MQAETVIDKSSQMAGLIAAAYLQQCGIKDSEKILNAYNARGIPDDEAIMLLVVSAFYYKSPLRQRLK